MANPTLITGFEDVMTYIRQQDERIKRLEEQEKKLRKQTCCADSEKLEDRISEILVSKNKYFAEVENHEETIDKLQKQLEERDNEWREIFDPSWRNLEPEDGKQYYEELKQEIEKLQKEIKEYEFESCESVVTSQKVYGQAFAIQAERDKLKEENEKLKEAIVSQNIRKIKELREEINKLQKELEEKKFDCEFLAKQLKAKYKDSRKIEGDTRTLGEVLESEKELKEHLLCVKNRKDEEIQQYKDTLEEHFVHYDNLKEENKKLKETLDEVRLEILHHNGRKRRTLGDLDPNWQDVAKAVDYIDELERIKALWSQRYDSSSEEEEDEPDRCVSCDKTFDLSYTIRHADEETKQKYDEYFGSEDDGGDLCSECLNK